MKALPKLFQKFSTKMDLFALLVMGIFFLMVRPADAVNDILIDGDYLYLALGRRGVRVLDIRYPVKPTEVGKHDTFSNAQGLAIRDYPVEKENEADEDQPDKKYLFVADGAAGVLVLDVSGAGAPVYVWDNGKRNELMGAVDIAIQDKYAYIARGNQGLAVVNVNKMPLEGGADAIWQVDVPNGANRIVISGEFAYIITTKNELVIYKIDNPKSTAQGQKGTYTFEAAVYDLYVENNTAYVATENGLALLNIENKTEISLRGEYTKAGAVKSVAAAGGFAYISGSFGLKVIDVAYPDDLAEVGRTEKDSGLKDAQKLILHGEYLYVADGLDGLKSVRQSLDVQYTSLDQFGSNSRTQGWIEDVALVKDEWAYLAGGQRGLWILDVSDREDPREEEYYDKTAFDEGVSVELHAKTIAMGDDSIFVGYAGEQKYYLRKYYLANPVSPQPSGFYDLPGEPHHIFIAPDNFVYVAGGDSGLCILDVGDSILPRIDGLRCEDTPGNAQGVAVDQNRALIADGESGIQVINILDKNIPTLVNSFDTPGDARAIITLQDPPNVDNPAAIYAYVADGSNGVLVLDVTNEYDIRLLKTIEIGLNNSVNDVAVRIEEDGKRQLFVSDETHGVVIFDLTDLKNPQNPKNIATPGKAKHIDVDGEFVYVADFNRGLRIVNYTNLDELKIEGFFDVPTQVQDVELLDENFAYLVERNKDSQNGYGALWSVNLEDLSNVKPSAHLKLTDQAYDLAIGSAYIAVANGAKGLQLVTNDPQNLEIVATVAEITDAQGVDITDTTAYVAGGGGGLYIVPITNTQNIKPTRISTNGYARGVDFINNYVYILTTPQQLEAVQFGLDGKPNLIEPQNISEILKDTKEIRRFDRYDSLFVADGTSGLKVIGAAQPLTPYLKEHLDTTNILEDIWFGRHFAFLADGTAGIETYYFPTFGDFQAMSKYEFSPPSGADMPGGETTCKPNALAIDVIPHKVAHGEEKDVIHYYVFIAMDECGLQIVDAHPHIQLLPLYLYITPGDAKASTVVGAYAGALGKTILGTWEARSKQPVYLLPAKAVELGRENFGNIFARVKDTARIFWFGFFLFVVGNLFWLALIANYVLPVRSPGEAFKSYIRLLLYFRGYHGPIYSVKEGKLDEVNSIEIEAGRPGIVRVDLNSAVAVEDYPLDVSPLLGIWMRQQKALIENRSRRGEKGYQARAEGPGVVFLQAFERIRGVADLRKQIRLRLGVNAATRDGIETLCHVISIFTLGENPDVVDVAYAGERIAENIRVVDVNTRDGKVKDLLDYLDSDEKQEVHRFLENYRYREADAVPVGGDSRQTQLGPYLFDEKRVFSAISSNPYDVNTKEIGNWDEFPPEVATGVFRNMISLEVYDNLFRPEDAKAYQIWSMKQELGQKVRYTGVLAYRYCENLDGTPVALGQNWNPKDLRFYPAQEFKTPKPLRARGYKMIAASFTELSPTDPNVTEKLKEYWQAEWRQRAMIIKADHTLQSLRIRNMAQTQAQSDLANTLLMILTDNAYSEEALTFRVLQALEAASSDPDTHRLLPRDTISMLQSLQNMLLPAKTSPPPDDSSSASGLAGPSSSGRLPDSGGPLP